MQAGLFIPVGVSMVGFFGNPFVWIPLVLLFVLGVVYFGKRYGWKKRWIGFWAFVVAFGVILLRTINKLHFCVYQAA